ncbi:MAG: MFS transporter, partial [Rhodothermales bacterium]|nr:MFS transporter [Rhodothermales bacterium]
MMAFRASQIVLGLRENWRQFSLLVVVNAFVGAMVGLERAVLPLIAEDEFGLASRAAILSFIASFGLAKALSNLMAGRWSDRYGRKAVLVSGWVIGLPVPLIVMWAPTWSWIVFANVLLGVNQGLAWSSTVIMKIDLVGPKQRGLAMGLNEAAGYVAVSLAALASGYIAAAYGLRPEPFYLGVVFALAGLALSLGLVRETSAFAALESESSNREPGTGGGTPSFARVLLLTSWRNRTLFSVSQAGMINNLNDGMAWGLFPLYFASLGRSVGEIGLLAALYPAVWGLGQLGTGALSDHIGRKPVIVTGMFVQAAGIAFM